MTTPTAGRANRLTEHVYMPARGASGGLAGASIWISNQPKTSPNTPLSGERFRLIVDD